MGQCLGAYGSVSRYLWVKVLGAYVSVSRCLCVSV